METTGQYQTIITKTIYNKLKTVTKTITGTSKKDKFLQIMILKRPVLKNNPSAFVDMCD